MVNNLKNKLIVFDTDGVIFKSQFLLHLSWYSGIFNYLRSLFLCILFNFKYLSIEELLGRIFLRLKGMSEEELWQVYYKMKIMKNAEETIRSIRSRGHCVALMSSGVPDFLVRHLARKLHANYGYGIDTMIANGAFTGEIGGLLSRHDGKALVVEQILRENNISWSSVIVVGDDRNNLDIMALAKASIGFNSNYPVRKKAKYLVDGNDLKKVLDYIKIEDDPTFAELSSGLRREFAFSWSQEFKRKAIHVCAAFIPIFASINFSLTIKLLLIISILYLFSEWLRLNGITFPILSFITRSCTRTGELRNFAFAPAKLSLGIVITLLLFPKIIAYVVIMILAFSDSIATMAGRYYGRYRIPYNRMKSVEGSLAFFVSAFVCSIFFIPLKAALLAAFVSCIIESLPLRFDNLTIPLGTGLILWLVII